MMKAKKTIKEILIRSFAALIALAVIATGARALIKDNLFYDNWWGGLVFAPLTIIIGALLLFLIIFKWETIRTIKR